MSVAPLAAEAQDPDCLDDRAAASLLCAAPWQSSRRRSRSGPIWRWSWAAATMRSAARSTPPGWRGELERIVRPLAEGGAFVVTIGLFDLARSGLVPEPYAAAMTERFDALTAEVAAAAGGRHVDTHHHPRSSDPGIYSSERIHANARGHAVAFAAIVRALSAHVGGGW